MTTRVVNVRYPGGFDVYIGRRMKQVPFTHTTSGLSQRPDGEEIRQWQRMQFEYITIVSQANEHLRMSSLR